MWNFVCKRKPLSEKVIDVNDHKKAGVYKLLDDRKLLGIVTMAKHYNKDIVLEFYVNLKSNIFDASFPFYHKVIVRSHEFKFSPKLINDYLNCKRLRVRGKES